MSKFDLTGHVNEIDGLWHVKITLRTPDGYQSTLTNIDTFATEAEAKKQMELKFEQLLQQFMLDGVEVLSRRELKTV